MFETEIEKEKKRDKNWEKNSRFAIQKKSNSQSVLNIGEDEREYENSRRIFRRESAFQVSFMCERNLKSQ